MSRQARTALQLGLIALALAKLGAANPADTFGLGSRSIAMGGAVSAHVPDTSANYYNPSALSRNEATELSFGFVAASPALKLNNQETPMESMRSLVLGLIVPGRLGPVPVAVGLSGQIAGDRLSRIVTFTEDDQRWVLFDNRPEQLYLSANIALNLTPWLSLGAGYSFLASTSGTLSVTGNAVQPGFGPATEFDSQLDHEVVADLESVRYPQFAITASPTESASFALVYRDEGEVALGVDSNISGTVAIGPLNIPTEYVLESKTIQSFVPRQLVLGTSVLLSKLRGNLDIAWVQWSRYPSPIGATASELAIEPPQGLVLDVPELPAATRLQRAKMSDRVTVRFGVEYWLPLANQFQVPLRAGFAWDPTGSDSRTSPNLIDADRYIGSIGTGFEWQTPSEVFPGHLRLDAHAQWVQLAMRQVPALSGGTHLSAAGHVIGFGANLSYIFSE